jgi:hypothetical protein
MLPLYVGTKTIVALGPMMDSMEDDIVANGSATYSLKTLSGTEIAQGSMPYVNDGVYRATMAPTLVASKNYILDLVFTGPDGGTMTKRIQCFATYDSAGISCVTCS